jgi:hypothetical protein
MEIGGMNSQVDSTCTNSVEHSISKYQAFFGKML